MRARRGMVTIHELFSADLPDLPGLTPESGAAEASSAEVALELLALQAASASRAEGGGGLCSLPPRPFLGFEPEVVPLPPEALEAEWEAVQDARERADELYRMALQRRAASRMASTPSPSRFGLDSLTTDDLPAVFPFPEPIPHGPPPRRPASQQQHRCRPAGGGWSPGSSRATPWSPMSSRLGGHDASTTATSPDLVPAVFPFPTPIPHGPPPRRPPRTSPSPGYSAATSSRVPSVASSGVDPRGENPGRLRKRECGEESFIIGNKERANGWISDCMPKAQVLEHEQPVWLQLKRGVVTRQRFRNKILGRMRRLPFDVWWEMKKQARDEEFPQADGHWRGRPTFGPLAAAVRGAK